MSTPIQVRSLLLFFLTIGLIVPLKGCSDVQPIGSPTEDLSHLVRNAYSGQRAFETVAFLDRHVRWPGNEGFNASIQHVAEQLEKAGFKREEQASPEDRITYRIESYPMDKAAWQPVDAQVAIEGDSLSLLEFQSNRNMLATYSFSTPPKGIKAQVVDAGDGSEEAFRGLKVKGKIVLVEGNISRAFQRAVSQMGAVGVLGYSLPEYLNPEINQHSIQFKSIPVDEKAKAWGINLSRSAFDRLRQSMSEGPVTLRVTTSVLWISEAVEHTLVAEIKGSQFPEERFVFSAHVQEPGANDNASGVGAQTEMARVTADLVRSRKVDLKRTITYIWGDEIRSTDRYVKQDPVRKEGIMWGLSLDMVGEDTQKTGGTFLIEKMPDPSAIWTRGEEKHTEWGGRPLTKKDMVPHYFNDLVLNRALEQAATNGWVVKTNPFEGGSDHVPFLRSDIPALLLWHFTDQFYHTDRDRIEMVSADELKNVGVTALVTAISLTTADGSMSRAFVGEVERAALERLETEYLLSEVAIQGGATVKSEQDILATWAKWYNDALASMQDIEVGGSSPETLEAIDSARIRVQEAFQEISLTKE